MIDEPAEALNKSWARVISSVLLFWVGYVAIALLAGFATSSAIASKLWQLTAWGLLSSAGLLALPRILMRIEKEPRSAVSSLGPARCPAAPATSPARAPTRPQAHGSATPRLPPCR
jgi:hypothetical protein